MNRLRSNTDAMQGKAIEKLRDNVDDGAALLGPAANSTKASARHCASTVSGFQTAMNSYARDTIDKYNTFMSLPGSVPMCARRTTSRVQERALQIRAATRPS